MKADFARHLSALWATLGARVALEERGRGVPGWLLRILYRPLVKLTIRQFERAIQTERLKVKNRSD